MSKSKDENRRLFPATAVVVDEFRSVFGDGVRLVRATEGGRTVGQPDTATYAQATAAWILEGRKPPARRV